MWCLLYIIPGWQALNCCAAHPIYCWKWCKEPTILPRTTATQRHPLPNLSPELHLPPATRGQARRSKAPPRQPVVTVKNHREDKVRYFLTFDYFSKHSAERCFILTSPENFSGFSSPMVVYTVNSVYVGFDCAVSFSPTYAIIRLGLI